MTEPIYKDTVEDLAEALNVKRSWVYSQTRKVGKVPDAIPCLIVGKYRRFNVPEVVEWLKKKQEG
jgi:hypothetical protein